MEHRYREIERKFLVLQDPSTWPLEMPVASAVEIRQGYLTPSGSEPEVRVREAREIVPEDAHLPVPRSRTGAHGTNIVCKLCTKGTAEVDDGGGLHRVEVELDIEPDVFRELWPLTRDRQLRKARVSYAFRVPVTEMLAVSVDWFRGHLQGLVLAEVEFSDGATARAFQPPSFLGREVTSDPAYRNSALACAERPPDHSPIE